MLSKLVFLAVIIPAFVGVCSADVTGYIGADGSQVRVSPSTPLPVTQSSVSLNQSGLSAVTIGPCTAICQSGSFTPAAGRQFNISLLGPFVGTCQLERYLNSTWQVITAGGVPLYVWQGPASESAEEDQNGIPYRVNCTYWGSGSISGSISQ